jgi:hypothetical protein
MWVGKRGVRFGLPVIQVKPVLPAAGMLARGKEEGAQNLDAMLLVACRREFVTTDAVRRVGVLPVDRLSIG